MKMLTRAAFSKAKDFLLEKGRLLDRCLFSYHFEQGGTAAVLAALAPYQNDDGGFGHALEADLRLADSSAIATSVAFQMMRQLNIGTKEPLAARGVEYLLATYDEDRQVWPIIPPQADKVPRAPWWDYAKSAESFGGFKANPRAELVGYLIEHAALTPPALLEGLTDALLAYLESLPDEMESHDFISYRRLAESPGLAPASQERIFAKLNQAANQVVSPDPAQWSGYATRPLWLAPTPDTPLATALGNELIGLNLDYEITQQKGDGSWGPPWSWFGAYPETWPQAEAEWHSKFTLDTLLVLRGYGRLEIG